MSSHQHATSGMARSLSSQHVFHKGAGGGLAHYDSQSLPAAASATTSGLTPSTSTPHLSHLRQSSVTLGLLHHDDHHPHYPTSADAYDVYEEIGVGAFATVYHAAIRETGEQVAIKVIDLDQFNTQWEEIRREIMIMSLVHHPNVVRILTSFVAEQDLWIIMPLLEAGSCAQIMKSIYPTGIKDEALVATILREVLHGLLYFHKDGRMHRDLKAGNVIISAQGEVQLADFGVASSLLENGDRKKARRTFTGTPCWMAPEVMEHADAGYDAKADIWSFGITALELAYGRAPYAKFPPMKVMVLTLQEEPPTADIYKDHSYEFSKHFHSMVEKCLRKDPSKRPNVQKLLEHKFFKSARDNAYVVDKIVKRLPKKKAPSAGTKLLNLPALRHPPGNGHDGHDDGGAGGDNRPVSVGSWVFDKDEFEEIKMRAAEEKEAMGPSGHRSQSLQQSYAEEETPRGAAPASSRPFGGAAAAAAAAPVGRSSLGVPGAGGHSRTPSSAEGSMGHSDEETHLPLPDFNDPSGGVAHAQHAMHNMAISVQAPGSGPASHSASPHATTPRLPTSPHPLPPTGYPAASSAAHAPAPTSSVLSPPGTGTCHQEGRFQVSEDTEEGDEECADGMEGDESQDGGVAHEYGQEEVRRFHEQQAQAHNGYYQEEDPQGRSRADTYDNAPAIHNEAYEESVGSEQRIHFSGEEGETQVGRFRCADQDDDDDQ